MNIMKVGEIMNITNIIDVLVFLTIALMGVIGFKKGFLKQTVSTIGFIIVVILAFYLKNPIAEFLSLYLPFFKFEGIVGGVTLNILLYQLISFLLVILILETVLNVLVRITGIIEKILKYTIILGIPSKILGMLVGLIEGFIIVFIALFFFKQPIFNIKSYETSKLAGPILNHTPVLSGIAGGFVDTFNDIYNLNNLYADKELSNDELNRRSIDVMLKHEIVTPNYIIKLVEHNKIEVPGILDVVNKYK